MKTPQTPPQFLIILRGPAGAGKTTLAKSLQRAAQQLVATIDSDLFSWEIVPGESDKALVYGNLLMLCENYICSGYSVVISGLIISSEEAGRMQEIRRLATSRGIIFLDFYCWAPRELVVQRNRARDKDVPEASVIRWWALAERDKQNVPWELKALDMTAELAFITSQVLGSIDEAQRDILVSGKTPPQSKLRAGS